MLSRLKLLLCACLTGILFLAIPASAGQEGDAVSCQAAETVTVSAPQYSGVELGSLVIKMNPLVQGEHRAEVVLPQGFSLLAPGQVQASEDPHVRLEISITGQPNEFRIHIDYEGDDRQLTFVVPIRATIPSGVTGDIRLEVKGFQGQFTDGSVVVGRVPGGLVDITSLPSSLRIITPETEVPFMIEVAEDQGDVLRPGAETLRFVLPEGFSWQDVETSVVVDGGYLPTARVDDNDARVLYVDIEPSEERKQGAFTLSGTIKPGRTFLTGAELRVQAYGIDLEQSQTLVLARVVEPRIEARFTVGSDAYIINGRGLTMDVVPYTKHGRLFLPLRYVGLSLGIEPDNIKWDGRVATLIGEHVTVRVQPGTSQLSVNGMVIEMDAAAEFSQGRVMLPYRFIAEAFGASMDWDPVARTVTMEL